MDAATRAEARQVIELRAGASRATRHTAASAHLMHRAIADVAGHRAVADAMGFADHSHVELERLQAERAMERKRGAL